MVTLLECVFWEKTDSKVTFISCCVDGGTKQMFVFLHFVRACFFNFIWLLKNVNPPIIYK